ncbi:mevalonate diphosphate decarboxylase 1 [Prunus dulcis]|uniref:Mevalonate diphosphate decarboxylase 1 n=1 Tax=Prunus dulcis TaxID=3755 RepID=A0A4Y1QYJ6_PRUDU|nr:mevalonate diphosphate decarboxylase 1 [Prunus dulcis]
MTVILNTIVSADIDPEERLLDSSLIDFDRASLLYAIGNNNVSIDLPAHIFRAICLAATPDDYYETHSAFWTDETSEESVVGFTPPPAPASQPSLPQLNQPPLSQTKSFEKFSIKLRKRMARLANEVVKLTVQDKYNLKFALFPTHILRHIYQLQFLACIQIRKRKKIHWHKQLVRRQTPKGVFGKSNEPQLRGEDVLAVISKIPNLSRLQVLKAVHMLLNTNPEEVLLLKYLPDDEKTEWIILLISKSWVLL